MALQALPVKSQNGSCRRHAAQGNACPLKRPRSSGSPSPVPRMLKCVPPQLFSHHLCQQAVGNASTLAPDPSPKREDASSSSRGPGHAASNVTPFTASQRALSSPLPPQPTSTKPGTGYWELLGQPDQDLFAQRARSASDAAVLRRKGHLKEQDRFIDFMRLMHETHSCEEVMMKMERWINEHRRDPRNSKLKRLVPTLGKFFTPLRLVDAFREYDSFFALSRRKYIPPNFAELRHIVNIAQVHASADTLKLITFDADGTLYADGCHMEHDNLMVAHMINLMRSNVQVAIVTAAGYPGDASKHEARVQGLLDAFKRLHLPPDITGRFHIMGGECNYLLRVTPHQPHLEFVPETEWKTPFMLSWKDSDIKQLLDGAQVMLLDSAARLNCPVSLLRKQRSVGVIPTTATIYEVLEDIALTLQSQLNSPLPFCAFNGGNDVFVDVGNKSLGLDALMRYLKVTAPEVLHVGDRFTDSGNDVATRDICSVLWVANPEETGFFIRSLLKDIRRSKWQPYIE